MGYKSNLVTLTEEGKYLIHTFYGDLKSFGLLTFCVLIINVYFIDFFFLIIFLSMWLLAQNNANELGPFLQTF